MVLIDSSNCPSFEIECGEKRGTGFQINPTTVLTVQHVVEEHIKNAATEIIVYQHGKRNGQGFSFKVIDSSKTLAWLTYSGAGEFPFDHIQLYRSPINSTPDTEVKAYGFLGDTNSGAPYSYPLKHTEKTLNPSDREYYNVHFSTSSYESYAGLSGAPIFWDNRLYGILGYEKTLDNTRLFGFCGEQFFQELSSHGYDIQIHEKDLKKILPPRPPVQSPDLHERQLRDALAMSGSDPIFVSGPDGIGKHWLAINFGHYYRDGNVYHVPFKDNFEETIESADLTVIPNDDRNSYDGVIKWLKNCESNDVLIITGANLDDGYIPGNLMDSKGYNDICALEMRVIITTRQPVPDARKYIWLENWSSKDLLRIAATRFLPNEDKQKRERHREMAERFFAEVGYNPLMVYFVFQKIPGFDYLEKITSYFQNLSDTSEELPKWLNKQTKREDANLATKAMWDHMFDIFNPDALKEYEKAVLGLVLSCCSDKAVGKKVITDCLCSIDRVYPEDFCKYKSAFDSLLAKGILAINSKNDILIPTISRLNFQKSHFHQDDYMNRVFRNELEKNIEELKSIPSPQIQLAEACADSYDRGYRDFFTDHFCENHDCNLCRFDSMMNSIWETARNNTEDISSKLGEAYQFLKEIYDDNTEAPFDVFAGKYYSLFAANIKQFQEMESFLKIQPHNVPDFFHRHNLLSILYGRHGKYNEAKGAAEEARRDAEHVKTSHNCYADIYGQLGLCWQNKPAAENKEKADNLRKAINHYVEANNFRTQSKRQNLDLLANTYRQIAYCYIQLPLCDPEECKCPSFDKAARNAEGALECDKESIRKGSLTAIKYVEKDYDLLIKVNCDAAFYAHAYGRYEEASKYIEAAEKGLKDKCENLKDANPNMDTINDQNTRIQELKSHVQ